MQSFNSMDIFSFLIKVFICWFPVHLVHSVPNDACERERDGQLLPFPGRCDWFVDCFGGIAYEKPCSEGLHFNTYSGKCDYPNVAKCKTGDQYYDPQYENGFYEYHNEGFRYDARSPDGERFPSERYEPEYRHSSENSIHRDHGNREVSPRPSYEETIYGVVPRHMKFSLEGGRHARMGGQGHGSELYASMKYPLADSDTLPLEYRHLQARYRHKGDALRESNAYSPSVHFSGSGYEGMDGDKIDIDLRGIIGVPDNKHELKNRLSSRLSGTDVFSFRRRDSDDLYRGRNHAAQDSESQTSTNVEKERFDDASKYPQYWPETSADQREPYKNTYNFDNSYEKSQNNDIILNEPELSVKHWNSDEKPSFTPYDGFKQQDEPQKPQMNNPDVERSGYSEHNYHDSKSRKVYAGVLRIPVHKLMTHMQYPVNSNDIHAYDVDHRKQKPQERTPAKLLPDYRNTFPDYARDHSSLSNMYIKRDDNSNDDGSNGGNKIRAKSSWIDSTSFDPDSPYQQQQQVVSQRMYHDEIPSRHVMEPIKVPHRIYKPDMGTPQSPHAPMMPMVLQESEMMPYKPTMMHTLEAMQYKPKEEMISYQPEMMSYHKPEMMSYHKPEMMSYHKPEAMVHKPVMMTYKPVKDDKPEMIGYEPEAMGHKPNVMEKKPNMIVYKPVAMERKPDTMLYKPMVMEKKPEMMFYKPMEMEKKPETMVYKPVMMESKPQMMTYKPVAMERKPQMMTYEPVAMERKPQIMTYKPVAMEGKPQMMTYKPVAMERKPQMMTYKPVAMEMKPEMVRYEPMMMEQKPEMKPDSMTYLPALMMQKVESMPHKQVMMAYRPAGMDAKPEMMLYKPQAMEYKPIAETPMSDKMVMKQKKPYKTAIDIKKTEKGTIIDILHNANEAAGGVQGYGSGDKINRHLDHDELKLRMTMEKRAHSPLNDPSPSEGTEKMLARYGVYKKAAYDSLPYQIAKSPGYSGYQSSLVNMLMKKMSKKGPEGSGSLFENSLHDNPSSSKSYLQNSFNDMLNIHKNDDSGRYFSERANYHAKELREDDLKKASSLKKYLDHVIEEAMVEVKSRLHSESQMVYKMDNVVDSGPFRYVSAFMNAKPYVKYISLSGMSMLSALKLLKNKFNLDGAELYDILDRMSDKPVLQPMAGVYRADDPMPIPPSMDYCPYPRHFTCDARHPFRSQDGSCNNLQVPIWGRSLIPFRRLLPAVYSDGIEAARRSVLGGPLPGARVISLHLFPDFDRPDSRRTLLLMTFGQFIDHDLTRTAITKMSKEEVFFDTSNMDEAKCGFDGCDSGIPGLEACWPIPIPEEDPDFPYNRCLKFVRSQEVPPLSCGYGPRQQLNQLTSWIDASNIYGSTKEETARLRDFSDLGRGQMLVTPHPHGSFFKPLLPQDDVELCKDVNATVKCFKAGDERVNENLPLSVLHTIWLREHNRIEDKLQSINPHWDGERLFQETRKIIGAMFQYIIFNEYMPVILGPELMRRNNLVVQEHGYHRAYDPSINPQSSSAFATAAFRYGHTLIHENVRRVDHTYNFDDSLQLSEVFRRPAPIYDTSKGGVDALIRGFVEQPCQTFDQFFTKQITKSLFTDRPPFGAGMDLISLNIQRGRDHGLPGYNAYREFCGLRRARNFEDLATEITDVRARRMLQKIYRHPDDIDLFAGGISEASVPGGVVGPTFGCILADQFRVVKDGDRFWHENNNNVGFTPEQLEEIRKTRLPRIICQNSDRIDRIQPNVFFHSANDYVPSLNKNLGDREHHEVWFESSAYINNFDREFSLDEPPQGFEDLAREHPKLNDLPPEVAFNFRAPCESYQEVDLTKWADRH